MRDVGLIKKKVEIDEFYKFCRNGVLISDLLNKLQGRESPIAGIFRTPSSYAQINSNFDKIMAYLKEFPRFSSRFLWSSQQLINGQEDVIWGFLDDIWYWHHGKISPHDPTASESKQLETKTKKTPVQVREQQ